MYPWLWFWAPQIHFPWSGAVPQNIEPRTAWFADHIPGEAGNAMIEAKVTELASYGKQLGLITEALIGLAEASSPTDPKAKTAIDRLKKLQSSIETIKEQEYRTSAETLVKEIQALRNRGGKEYEALAKALLPVLSGTTGA